MIRGKRQLINKFNLTEEEYQRYYIMSVSKSDYNMEDIIQFAREWDETRFRIQKLLKVGVNNGKA